MQIVFTLLVGYVYDLVGRRVTVIGTIMPAGVIVMLMPYAAPSITLLILLRLGLVVGTSALSSNPFVNDYVKKETRGRAIAI
jgi:MFS family permease